MKFAKLLHNPGAGEGDYGKKELVSMVQSAGFGCSYSSTKKDGWEKIESKEIDFIILAGGDGTVRRLAESLLNRKLLDKKYPIALLPMGTANNIAKTLGLPLDAPEDIIQSWHTRNIRDFDVGRIYGLKKNKFFLESFGVGLFPELMARMKKVEKGEDLPPAESLKAALNQLLELVREAEARFCRISIDGVEHKGNYLMVEVMNTVSMGPRLNIAPLADPSDGVFDVVLVSEKEREQFIEYINTLLEGKEEVSFFKLLRAKRLQIFWDGSKAHVDDEVVDIKRESSIEIELLHGVLEFFGHTNGKGNNHS